MLNDIRNQMIQGHSEEEMKKDRLIDRKSTVNAIESCRRLANERKSKQMEKEAAEYNQQLAQKSTGRRPKRSVGSRPDGDLIYNRVNR